MFQEKIGIIIPTMNRSEFLIRQLRYYVKINSPHPVYISDASNEEHHKKILVEIEKLSLRLKINYIHNPTFTERQAIAGLLNIVEETYCAFTGDDDFLIPSGLVKCAEFLDSHPDYRTAQGHGVVFTLQESGAYGSFSGASIYWRLPQREEESVEERLIQFAKHYWVPLFSVHRTKEFLEDWSSNDSNPNKAFGEIMPNFLTIIRGKSKFLDCLYLLRQHHNARYTVPSIMRWVDEESWRTSYALLREKVSNALELQGIDRERAIVLAEEAFWHYFAAGVINKYQGSKKNILKQYIKTLFPFLKGWGWGRLHFSKNKFALPVLLNSSSPYTGDFHPIYELISQ